ncbi:unnamed protein product [Meganyctiphanes norvegica]|uniref:Uncharacterized protein n=1 Tax=Meganyctiphanes norvegica TaxID=48144 RepID=A0AAV2QQI4_MEGNR
MPFRTSVAPIPEDIEEADTGAPQEGPGPMFSMTPRQTLSFRPTMSNDEYQYVTTSAGYFTSPGSGTQVFTSTTPYYWFTSTINPTYEAPPNRGMASFLDGAAPSFLPTVSSR